MAHAIVVAASNVHSFQHRQSLGAVFDHRVDPGGVERADITERDISQRVETTLIVTATPHEPVAQHPTTPPPADASGTFATNTPPATVMTPS